MTTQFNPGDRVRCVEMNRWGDPKFGTIGSIYTVKSHRLDRDHGGVLQVDELDYCLSGNRFALHAKAGEPTPAEPATATPTSITCNGVDFFPHSLELRTAIANVEAGIAEIKRLAGL